MSRMPGSDPMLAKAQTTVAGAEGWRQAGSHRDLSISSVVERRRRTARGKAKKGMALRSFQDANSMPWRKRGTMQVWTIVSG